MDDLATEHHLSPYKLGAGAAGKTSATARKLKKAAPKKAAAKKKASPKKKTATKKKASSLVRLGAPVKASSHQIGSSTTHTAAKITCGILGIATTAAIGLYLYKRRRTNKTNNTEEEQQQEKKKDEQENPDDTDSVPDPMEDIV